MAHSLEVRPAFLDHRIVEFAATLPAKYCIRGRTLKLLLRNLMKDKLPQSVLAKKKQGLDIPVHDWLRGRLKPLLLDTLNQRTVEETGIVSWPYLESLIRLHMERKAQLRVSLMGHVDVVSVDPAVEDRMPTGPEGLDGGFVGSLRRFVLGLRVDTLVLVVACCAFLPLVLSPPHLMDDVDAVRHRLPGICWRAATG